jgi:nitroreductase
MPVEVRDADDEQVRAVARLIRERRTTNLFEPRPVARSVLLDAIALARWAPNHRLTEPWRFYLLGPETTAAVVDCWSGFEAQRKGELAAAARRKRLEAIPGHFDLTSARDEDGLIEHENYAACCCAAQNLMLYLWQRGVGTKWTTGAITREPRFYDLLGIDAESERIVGYFWYGVPRVIADQRRRDVDQIVVDMS